MISKLPISDGPLNGMGEMKNMADTGHDKAIPYYNTLRRIPERYRETLSLSLMKQYQCVVIGSARGVVTVAISDHEDISILETMSRLLGRSIFPVLVSPVTIRLVIRRFEHYQRSKARIFGQRPFLNPAFIDVMVMTIMYMLENQQNQE
ncbi:MAG TPA: hypothetical protein VFA09_24495 [Ktedonobacteraceae bacterium]|nr:hypothetical protein [Ktedonobacteraceae bacterium]